MKLPQRSAFGESVGKRTANAAIHTASRVGSDPLTGATFVFLQSYKGFQVTVVEGTTIVTRSAGLADNLGFELEAKLALGEVFSLFGTFAYIAAASARRAGSASAVSRAT